MLNFFYFTLIGGDGLTLRGYAVMLFLCVTALTFFSDYNRISFNENQI